MGHSSTYSRHTLHDYRGPRPPFNIITGTDTASTSGRRKRVLRSLRAAAQPPRSFPVCNWSGESCLANDGSTFHSGIYSPAGCNGNLGRDASRPRLLPNRPAPWQGIPLGTLKLFMPTAQPAESAMLQQSTSSAIRAGTPAPPATTASSTTPRQFQFALKLAFNSARSKA